MPGGDVPADEALPDVGRVPVRNARGQDDVGLGAPAADDGDLVDGGAGVVLFSFCATFTSSGVIIPFLAASIWV